MGFREIYTPYPFHSRYSLCIPRCILGLLSFPRECEDMAAMLDDTTKEVNEKYFVNVLQHGRHDVTCNQRIEI
jgi:hypothetical protein